jgi:hypothetical protein
MSFLLPHRRPRPQSFRLLSLTLHRLRHAAAVCTRAPSLSPPVRAAVRRPRRLASPPAPPSAARVRPRCRLAPAHFPRRPPPALPPSAARPQPCPSTACITTAPPPFTTSTPPHQRALRHRVFCRTLAAALQRIHATLPFASPSSQRRVVCDRDGS